MSNESDETDDSTYFETDADTGRIEKKYSDEDILDIVHTQEAAGTGDVANALGCTRRTARLRLKQLAEDGEIQSVKSSAGYMWLPAENDE